ncbi:MAG TPA: hypothetical protein VLD37_05120 [Candidatus Bilamarchaeum sp.]|nr:hypothetical protein [Candidatus Bilamarchaeum sp.]
MGWVRYLSVLLMLSASFAVTIIESGDGGAAFVNETAAAKCQEPDVQAVYKCLGNVVRVVSSVPGQGSAFYWPDGRVAYCPVVEPKDMGAECLAMMGPNYCPTQAECGAAPVPQVFPGQNDTAEQVGDSDYYIIEGQAAAANESAQIAPPPPPVKTEPKKSTVPMKNELEVPTSSKAPAGNLDSPLNYLVYIVLLLGVGSVGVLFFLFKNSMAEDA